MHRTLLGFSLLLAIPSFAQRHFVIEPEHVLSDKERSDLAARGIEVQQSLSVGRYVVRVADGAAVQGDRLVRSASAITASRKIERAALRSAAAGKPFIDLNIFFFDDVPFEVANEAISSVGGTRKDVFQSDFGVLRVIPARIPSSSLSALASDDRVMLVYGRARLRAIPNNANAAIVSNVQHAHSAPYFLTGDGVVTSIFEIGAPDANHAEFGGRLINSLPESFTGIPPECFDAVTHATHVSGTIAAAGLDPRAKGMAPRTTLRAYDADDHFKYLELLARKRQLNDVTSLADNNSWGYGIGWSGNVWTDSAEYYGGYDSFYAAGLDKVARASTALMVHSAGNDAFNRGPQSKPFAHSHLDDEGNVIQGRTYCYSEDNTGTDCPSQCTAGFCETVRHPQITSQLPAPWISVGVTTSAKNVLVVGAIDAFLGLAGFSSRGPTRDGRVKPEVVADGSNLLSTYPRNDYRRCSGTSMAAPVVTGIAALMAEQWRRTFGGDPKPVALKTLLIAGARDLGNPGPDFSHGYGVVDAKATADLIRGRLVRIDSLSHGGVFEVPMFVSFPGNVRVVLGWSDPEVFIFPSDDFATSTLINDLDLKVIGPGGTTTLPYVLDATAPERSATRGVNTVDNTEMVEIFAATPGDYRVVVSGKRVTDAPPQEFVVVANGELGATRPPCVDSSEPNNSQETAYGFLASQETITGRMCEAGDVDFFKFTVDRPGTVSVTVVSADTPLRVTLTNGGSVDIAPGGSQTLTTQYLGSTPGTFYVRIESIGAVGGTASYTVTPVFSHSAGKHRRTVRR